MAGRHTGKSALSRRYAAALFALAREKNGLGPVEEDMAALAALWEKLPDLRAIAANPALPRAAIGAVFREIAKKIKAHALTARFLNVLGEHRRLALLPAIVASFHGMMQAHRREVTAVVTSVAKLGTKHVQTLSRELGKATGRKVVVEERLDPEILGGLTVRIGSLLLDDSLAGKLARLRLEQKHVNA